MLTYRIIENYIKEAMSDSAYACSHWAGNGAIAKLEDKLCSLYGAKHALCVDSATNGLLYLILASGLKQSEIMTTSLSFGGTVSGALSMGCSFSFADVDNSLNIDPESVRDLLQIRQKTKAIIAVDYAGNPHQMEAINAICKEYSLLHFVDAAQSMGAIYPWDDVASHNDAMVVSFGGGKSVFSGGEGGAIITNNTVLYERLLSTCQHAHRQERDLGIGCSHEFALNGRMHPIASILACECFEAGLSAIQEKREIYLKALSVLSSFSSVSSILDQQRSAFYHCPFIVKSSELFETEFKESGLAADFYFTGDSVLDLPDQLVRANLWRRIKATYCPRLDDIKNRIYYLHQKTLNHV